MVKGKKKERRNTINKTHGQLIYLGSVWWFLYCFFLFVWFHSRVSGMGSALDRMNVFGFKRFCGLLHL